jgi:hypothetical protein
MVASDFALHFLSPFLLRAVTRPTGHIDVLDNGLTVHTKSSFHPARFSLAVSEPLL